MAQPQVNDLVSWEVQTYSSHRTVTGYVVSIIEGGKLRVRHNDGKGMYSSVSILLPEKVEVVGVR